MSWNWLRQDRARRLPVPPEIRSGYVDPLPQTPPARLILFFIRDPMSDCRRRIETYKALQKARQEGKVRSVGLSDYDVPYLEKLAESGYKKPSVNQIEVRMIIHG